MPDYLRRTVRTFCQALLGSLLTSGALSSASTEGVVDWSVAEKAAVAALAAGVIAAFTLVQNLLEDHAAMPALLKNVRSSKGQVDAITILVIVLLVILIVWLAGGIPNR